MIIGISGKIGSGKDTVGNIIRFLIYKSKYSNNNLDEISNDFSKVNPRHEFLDYSGFKIKKFAGKLKQIVAILTGCTLDDLESSWFKEQELGEDWANGICVGAKSTFRELLQKLGTDVFKTRVHPSIHCISLFTDYTPESNWIITDMRFLNELEAVKIRKGVTIRIVRGFTDVGTHSSETELDTYKGWDYLIDNNSTVNDLVIQVKNILLDLKLI